MSINWRQLSAEVFREAQSRGCVVMLVLEQFWSGACREMQENVWNDETVAGVVESLCVPVKLDADKHPDVDRRFGIGKWPSIAFLTGEGGLITTAGQLTAEAMINAVDGVSKIVSRDGIALQGRLAELEDELEKARNCRFDPARKINPWMLTTVLEGLKALADADFGGFGEAPKYPCFDAVELLLRVGQKGNNPELVDIAVATLDGMMQCGLYDWNNGGFFRCSDEADWSLPKTEKLLIDQARHILNYLTAYEIFGTRDYFEAVEGTLEYCGKTLLDRMTGLYRNSQAAGPEYYSNDLFTGGYGAAPPVDETVILESSSWMIRALVAAAKVLYGRGLVEQAELNLAKLSSILLVDGDFCYRYWDGQPCRQGLLQDQVSFAAALVDLYEATGKKEYLQRALALSRLIHERLVDPRLPGYFDAENPLAARKISARDKSFEDNMALAILFSKLAKLDQSERWIDWAENCLRAFSGVWDRLGIGMASFGLGLMAVYGEDGSSE